ncbi:MAG TPA: hypothetical protein VG652_04290 [Gaiellaceae bacterium]|nr:hypothetical protein [Gaiellaceae bacterium]
MQQIRRRGALALVAASLVSGLIVGAVSAASAVSGSVVGAVTSVAGSAFTIKSESTSGGSSKVKLSSKTAITKQTAGTFANLKTGACVRASGTPSGTALDATQVVITGVIASQCAAGFGRANAPQQAAGATRAGGFTPSGGFAVGTISAIKGSTLTVTGRFGAKPVVLSSKTTVLKTVTTTAAAIALKECAFVRGTSTDGGVTVEATNVSLSAPAKDGCGARPGGG